MSGYIFSPIEFISVGMATEATLNSVLSRLPNLNSGKVPVEVNLTDVATQTTLSQLNTKVDSLATEATLSSVSSRVNPVSSYKSRFRRTNLTNAAVVVKSSAAVLFGYNIINLNATAVYLKFFNHASPTIGTTIPVMVLCVSPQGSVVLECDKPILSCETALSIACVTEIADSNNTAPATDVYCEVSYA